MSEGEEERHQADKAGEPSAEELYDMAPCGYLSTLPDGHIVRVNQTLVEWTGYSRAEFISGLRFMDLLTVGGKLFYETHFSLMLRLHGHADEIAFDLLCKDNHVIPALVSATQKRDREGAPFLNRITVFNATERRLYEQELLRAKRKAQETAEELARSNAALLKANEELGQFAHAASHDLQEPLRTITAFAELLARRTRGTLDEETSQYIAYILDGSRRMHALIHDLLSFSQTEASNIVLRMTSLQDVVRVALSNLHQAITESGASVTVGDLPCLNVDPSRMAQLFQNLIGNAVKYRKPDDPPRIHITATEKPQEWIFSVRDNGLGFEPADAERIFGVFQRLHSRQIPGTGIGLAICKKIVESHNGRIWAESTPGMGSVFHFSLPFVELA